MNDKKNKDEDNKIIDTKEKSIKELMIIESMKNIKEPYKSLTVNDIAKDLKIGINTAYDLFRQDFLSIKLGKQQIVMMIDYLVWKLKKNI